MRSDGTGGGRVCRKIVIVDCSTIDGFRGHAMPRAFHPDFTAGLDTGHTDFSANRADTLDGVIYAKSC